MSYLLYAVWEHSYGITKFLLENEADPNTVSSLTSTPDVIEPRLPLEISCYDGLWHELHEVITRKRG